ncbi:ribosome maturation factor RimM [Anaerosacchariphilus sp. NSJ-68]|uniref:Ribosome maturation factor RimM n=2 Tax=Lachnospiraceae TaxID=186803 RepID=A0A923RP12_9FIRM|nr:MULTISPECIES: ribosome maturation factor RimM [Lachnospiraceae]MBC5659920.1 ribosome maturation factor RimM [Anaerosacchariphilus hominis]MBC5697587.1 ribosome maturation factor RimM [Roseburia difficilis]
MEQYLRVGVIASTHGLKGEVKVFPTTDEPERFRKLKKVFLDTGKEYLPLKIKSVKFFKNQVILKFDEFQDINEVEKYRGKDLLIDREQALPLAENENFIVDLIDMDVYDEEEQRLGTLTDVLQTGANDVYVVETEEGKEILLPAIPSCILEVDVEAAKMIVRIPEGLL